MADSGRPPDDPDVEIGAVDRAAANDVLVKLNPVVSGGGRPVGAIRASYV